MNQHQLTMTRGDDRTFAIVIDDEYVSDTATLIVDGLLTKTATVGSDPGSGYATASFDIASADTEDVPDRRTTYRYEVSVDNEGDTVTVRRGILVVLPDLETVA